MSLEELRVVIEKIQTETLRAIGLETVIKIGRTKPISEFFLGTPAGYVVDVTYRSLLRELIMTVWRLHEDGSKDQASLPKAFRLLRRPAVRDDLISWYQLLHDGQGRDDSESQIYNLERLWKTVRKQNRSALADVQATRHGLLAHNLVASSPSHPLYEDLFSIVASTRLIAEKLARTIGMGCLFEDALDLWPTRANDYWDTLMRGRDGEIVEK